MRLPGTSHVEKSVRWWRSRFVTRALILGYHRITDRPEDSYSLGVTPKNFDEQLAVLRAQNRVMWLPDMMTALHNQALPKRAVVLTFDDGYADNLHNAKPLLEKYEAPATVFV